MCPRAGDAYIYISRGKLTSLTSLSFLHVFLSPYSCGCVCEGAIWVHLHPEALSSEQRESFVTGHVSRPLFLSSPSFLSSVVFKSLNLILGKVPPFLLWRLFILSWFALKRGSSFPTLVASVGNSGDAQSSDAKQLCRGLRILLKYSGMVLLCVPALLRQTKRGAGRLCVGGVRWRRGMLERERCRVDSVNQPLVQPISSQITAALNEALRRDLS